MAKTKPKHWSECKTEAEEAKWWDQHPEYVEALIEKAAAAGTLRRGRRAIGVVDPAPRIPAKVNVKSVRARTGLSQSEFAVRYGFSPRSLQHWEQGRRQPGKAARAYLTVIARASDVVRQALAG
ncbi:MAG: helix-turn-helix domain-containing protein [Acidobacteriota bacterium]